MVTIASGKGGVGKSTLAANLGIALGQMQQQVCLFDADANLANINILFGVTPRYTLQDCLSGNRSLEQVLLAVSERLQIVPAASGIAEFIELSAEQQQRLMSVLRTIEQQSDLILVDSAAGIGSSQLNFFLAATCSILVITPEPTSLTDAFSFLKMARRFGFQRTVYVIINQASDLHAARSAFKRFKGATEKYLQLEVGYLGYVLHDPNVPDSVSQQKPVMLNKPDCLASRCIRVISERLLRLLNSETSSAGNLSRYLSEMNQPFAIEVAAAEAAAPETEAAVSDEQWQQQVLERLGKMPFEQGRLFLQRANREWSVRHGQEGAALFQPADSAPGSLLPGESKAVERPFTTLFSAGGTGDLTPGGHFAGSADDSDCRAAATFAEMLARAEAV